MHNKDLLKLLNINDKRVIIKSDNFLNITYHNKERINQIKGTLSYQPKYCIKCKSNSNHLLKIGFDTVKIQIPNIANIKTYLILNKQRYLCKNCQKTFTLKFRDCKKHCRKSNTLRNTVDYYLMNNKISQTDISEITKLSKSTISKQLNDYKNKIIVNKNNLPEILCIDEICGVKTDKGKYNCIIYDSKNNKVKDIIYTRRKLQLEKYLNTYTKAAKKQVKYFVSDMYDTYINIANKHFKQAKIIIDRFHIVNLLIRMIDTIRIKEMNKYSKYSLQYRVLKKFNKKLKKRYIDISYDYQKYTYYPDFKCEYDILKYIISLSKDLDLAYYLLQNVFSAFDNKNIKDFEKIFTEEEIYKQNSTVYTAFKTLRKYKEYIKNAIIYPYSNGRLESANAKIKQLKRNAYGFRNFDNFRARIFMIFNYKIENNNKKTKRKDKAG